ncbi:MAG: hypothetical protein U9N84_02280 [Actinomycetota bacterium]|nr:hypothetical protein [Actinomycetota bacterium]
MRRTHLLIGTMLLVLTACTSSDPGTIIAEVRTSTLVCSSMIDSSLDLPSSYTDILGVVALPTSESAPAALQVNRDDKAPPIERYWAKTGLVVMAGRSFELRIADDLVGSAAMGWGSPAQMVERVVDGGCEGGSGWVAYPGGFVVDEPRCIRITVKSGNDEQTVDIGVGAPCDGQEPPPYPSDS